MFHNLYKFIFLLIISGFVISCQKNDFLDDIVFDNNLLNKININAELKEVNNFHEYKISEKFIDQTMLISPSQRIDTWLEDNIFTFGSTNKLIINIEEASITQNEIVNKEKTKSLVSNKEYLYIINIIVNFILYDDSGSSLATTNVEVNRSTTSSLFISINERNHILDSLTLDALRDVSNKSIELLKIHMSEYVL